MPAKIVEGDDQSGRSWDLLPRKSITSDKSDLSVLDISVHGAEEPSFLASMLAGASAGVAARLPCHPIDTIKAQLQVNVGTNGSFWKTFSKTVRAEGIPGLYRGIGGHEHCKVHFISLELIEVCAEFAMVSMCFSTLER
jgi:hypothetical protein